MMLSDVDRRHLRDMYDGNKNAAREWIIVTRRQLEATNGTAAQLEGIDESEKLLDEWDAEDT